SQRIAHRSGRFGLWCCAAVTDITNRLANTDTTRRRPQVNQGRAAYCVTDFDTFPLRAVSYPDRAKQEQRTQTDDRKDSIPHVSTLCSTLLMVTFVDTGDCTRQSRGAVTVVH